MKSGFRTDKKEIYDRMILFDESVINRKKPGLY